MNYKGPVYRPPLEHDSFLLQVTVGCAHNKCTFCTMYKDVLFSVSPMEEIEEDLKEARQYYSKVNRIFLVNGDAFVLSASRIKAIAEKVIEYFPECQTISMYASIRNIMTKTDEELRELKNYRINDLYVGLESGDAEVITKINKGYSLDDAVTQLKRLNEAEINHISLLMLGVAGKGRGKENARNTVNLLNLAKPKVVIVCTLGIFYGGQLEKEYLAGEFLPATEVEVLEEEKALIEGLDLDNALFFGLHPTNTIPVYGTLPGDKAKILTAIDYGINNLDKGLLEKSIRRTSL